MKLIKMFGLAAIAAVAAMAFVGASSASAEDTALCTEASATLACPAGKLVTTIESLDPVAQLLTSIISFKCHALLKATVLGLAAPQISHATSLVYTGCTNSCSATTLKLGLIETLKEGTELASVKGTGFEVEAVCSGLKCVYGATNLVGHALGPAVTGDNGHVTYNKASLTKIKGILCPATSELDALFVGVGTPSYIRG